MWLLRKVVRNVEEEIGEGEGRRKGRNGRKGNDNTLGSTGGERTREINDGRWIYDNN